VSDIQLKVTKSVRLECFWALWKEQNKSHQRYLQKGKRRSERHSNPVSRQQMCQNGHNTSQESIWESGGEVGDGVGKRVMKCEMCTEMTKRGGAGKGSASKGCRTWPDMC
jgi:hypothetical protein